MLRQNIEVTQDKKLVNPAIHVVQGDTGRTVVALVKDATISGTATMAFERPDGATYTTTATVNSDNSVEATFTADMLRVAGTGKATFKVVSSGSQVSTYQLYVLVEPSAGFERPVTPSNNKIYVYVNGSPVEVATASEVASKASQLQVDGISTTVNNLVGRIVEDESNIVINATTLSNITPKVTKNESDISELKDDLSQIIIKSKNLVDTSKSTVGFLANADGLITPNEGYRTTDYIAIESGKKYAMSPRIRKLLVFREDKYPDYTIPMVDSWFTNYIFTATRTGFIRVSYATSEESEFQIAEGDTVTPYMPYGKTELNIPNILKDKTVYAFGDSLMFGHMSRKGIMDGLCAENGMTLTKYAFNGANIVLNHEIETQVNNASATTPDFVIFDGLMNDASNATLYSNKLGELSSSFDATTFDTTTFYGAFEHLLSVIRNKYMTANVIFVCCHKTPTRNYSGQILLQKAVRECCNKWCIPYVDIFNDGQINCYIDSMRNTYSYNNEGETSGGNGTHLTGEGYNKWYAPQIKEKMLSLLENN